MPGQMVLLTAICSMPSPRASAIRGSLRSVVPAAEERRTGRWGALYRPLRSVVPQLLWLSRASAVALRVPCHGLFAIRVAMAGCVTGRPCSMVYRRRGPSAIRGVLVVGLIGMDEDCLVCMCPARPNLFEAWSARARRSVCVFVH